MTEGGFLAVIIHYGQGGDEQEHAERQAALSGADVASPYTAHGRRRMPDMARTGSTLGTRQYTLRDLHSICRRREADACLGLKLQDKLRLRQLEANYKVSTTISSCSKGGDYGTESTVHRHREARSSERALGASGAREMIGSWSYLPSTCSKLQGLRRRPHHH